MKTRSFKTAALLLIVLLTSLSCSRKIGYGVVLWSDQDGLKNGSQIEILEESRIRSSYIVQVKGTKDRFELPTWRVRFFEKNGPSEEFAAAFNEFIPVYAYSNKQGLPMREEPSTSSERVYKFREGQEVKVLGKGEKEKVGRFEGHWYHVLTDDGVEGYVFDALLTVYSLNDQQEMVVQNQREQKDPLLDAFFSTSWRPDSYAEMISRKQIDLALFRPEYGLTADLESMTISLKTLDKEISVPFEKVTRIGANRYDFVGTSFRITVNSENFISVQYKYDGLELSQAFIRLNEDVETIIGREKERRAAMLQDFVDRGPEMVSRAYGTILFENAGRFTWIDKSALISQQLLSVSAGNSGYVSFRNFPAEQIRSRYDGVITFNFESGESADFLYVMRDTGVNLLYVNERYIVNRVVTSDQFFSPVQMFFTFTETEETADASSGDGKAAGETGAEVADGSDAGNADDAPEGAAEAGETVGAADSENTEGAV
jgi:hypothetical protein